MSALAARARALLALDGPLAGTVLAVFRYFTVSVSYLACLVPLLAFTALVGWQATHLAVWLGSASLLPIAPATFALLRSTRVLLVERGDAAAGRVFWSAFAEGCRHLWWTGVSLVGAAVLLGYDLALFGGSDVVVLLVAAGAALAVALLVGVCVVATAHGPRGAVETVTAAAKAIARRPHVALSWLLLLGLGLAATAIPVLGPTLALFLPALIGAGIHICNDALRLPLTDETRQTP
ncbi:hypothetical protein IF188_12960 [Microbacterium sp. NEAU-LLC]|uniref:DUF624 domain-containing protein n=1 Tax=Microbacterium helvum TaxID=2773713 RepID=A0ABR8NPP9_9MICO|nr:hypothetical protein [Microbacterium helvum]MBD3942609.1 hypothetical protein [Microbacterium helvum]